MLPESASVARCVLVLVCTTIVDRIMGRGPCSQPGVPAGNGVTSLFLMVFQLVLLLRR